MNRYDRERLPAAGFTLVELMIAVALMAVIILVIGYIFKTTTEAISVNQANAEMHISLASFEDRIRNDFRGLEPNGFLVFGRRQSEGYGSVADRSNELITTLRKDWLLLTNTSELQGALNENAMGTLNRILYGHGQVSDPTGSSWMSGDWSDNFTTVSGKHANYSDLATDWILMRSHATLLAEQRYQYLYDGSHNVNIAGGVGEGRLFDRMMWSYPRRDCRWMDYDLAGSLHLWCGMTLVDYGSTYRGARSGTRAIYEPAYYHFSGDYTTYSPDRMNVLGHCGHFQVQFAMPEALSAGPGGTIAWRDGPLWHDPRRGDPVPSGFQSPYPDPNYRPGDTSHPNATIPVGQVGQPQAFKSGYTLDPVGGHKDAGRLMFGPGDRWPALLKITARAYDPRGRLDGPQSVEIIIPLP